MKLVKSILFVFLVSTFCSASMVGCGFEAISPVSKSGGCSVEMTKDKKSAFLTCTDGVGEQTTIVVRSGKDGLNGLDGTGCHVEDIDVRVEVGSKSGVRVLCDDGSSVVIYDGKNGQNAPPMTCWIEGSDVNPDCVVILCSDGSDYEEPMENGEICTPAGCVAEMGEDNCLYSNCDGGTTLLYCPDMASDADGDGVSDALDNCPYIANANQLDTDSDGTGDACETQITPSQNDFDGDSVLDNVDNCWKVANISQADWNGDGQGDACDDSDNDGVMDDVDNCQKKANADQLDSDSDGIGDVCDSEECYADTNCEDGEYCNFSGECTSSVVENIVTFTVAPGYTIFGATGLPDEFNYPIGNWENKLNGITCSLNLEVCAFNVRTEVDQNPIWVLTAEDEDPLQGGAWCLSPMMYGTLTEAEVFVGNKPEDFVECEWDCAYKTGGHMNWLCTSGQ